MPTPTRLLNAVAAAPGARQSGLPVVGLYDPAFEHDACGVGFLVNLHGEATHEIVAQGIEVLVNLEHRGATGEDAATGDGAGLLFQVPDAFLRREMAARKCELPAPGRYGVGMLFLPADPAARQAAQTLCETVVAREGLRLIGWREVPVEPGAIGAKARRGQPHIAQLFVGGELEGEALERKLYVLRRCLENESAARLGAEGRIYVPSFSIRTIVYKGLMLAPQVARFYPDLGAPDLVSALCVVHQRYSTNTFPSWELAQPFRYLAHNGEINTLRGNLNWMRSREPNLASPLLGDDLAKLLPVIDETGSDSACLDNALELLVAGGRSLCHALLMLIPQAWGAKYPMGPDLRGFFDYHAGLMEPWDGPAAVAFSDGRAVGALLDRNGLRPARYTLTHQGFMVFASEAGVLDIPARQVKAKGALRPGQMLLADLGRQRLLLDTEIKMRLARAQPYRRWVEENKIMIHGFFDAVAPVRPDTESLSAHQRLFGYTREDLKMVLDPMASTEQEPVGSMGADEALAIFSEKPQLLYWYFKQTFAQVTNPAIDPIREELVMSLMTFIGTPDNILAETPEQAHLLKLNHPVLSNDDLIRIRGLNLDDFACKTLSLGLAYPADGARLAAALEELGGKAEAALRAGYRIVILSDKDLPAGELPMPALLAVAAVNRHLVRARLRTRNGLLLETGEAREVQHLALLLGYGASAINPYLAFETVADMAQRQILRTRLSVPRAIENYTHALCKGLLKVMSKSGISTLRSYRNAQVFEAVGLNSDVINTYFSGTPSRIEGLGLEEIAVEANARYAEAYVRPEGAAPILSPGGHYALRADGERHLWTPESIHALQRATRENDFERYRQYAGLINEQARNQCTLRGLMAFKAATPIPLEEVEPVEALMKRFVTGAMSYGSISLEAHQTLAIAMNRIGGKSNSGEGGEDRARYQPDANGDSRASAIKQIASGRFGVTAEYLANGQDLQIKIAQGAKPGEGGQLPGFKVNAEIARTRHSTPGVTLISPPPHHDIYSIEDIAQLIYDLKCANPEARISVKLVSRAGVGTVAAGVAKARSDVILISGYDGGTGASPLSSLKHAGTPWELGLAETQQTLVLNGLRTRVILQVDGQIKTGRDVIIGALLGAEEFGFATAVLVVCGCVMMRKCHKNTCPVGIATQDAELRKRYTGRPEHVVNYLRFVAQEARELMAQLGVRRLDDLVGASERLEMSPALRFWKARGLDYSKMLYQPAVDPAARRAAVPQQHGLEQALDYELLPAALPAIEKRQPVVIERPIRNVHRTVGTILSSRIAKRHGLEGLPEDTLTLRFTGSAGQSFGAFCSPGMTLELTGEANDYLAKGLSGARVVVKPWPEAAYDPAENIIAGNVILYGATSGACYINGAVGERFAIRNSGALAVVEGVGDHGCEYMTGGRVVILGPTGVNFAAGMSGGIAYVYDESGLFDARCNLGMVDLETVAEPAEQDELRGYLEQHVKYTGSARAAALLADWHTALPYFVKVFPMEYKKVLGYLSREDLAIKRPETPNN